LNAQERAAIDQGMAALRAARDGADHRAIKRAIEAMDQASAEFAARRMDAGIKKALAGHHVDEI